MGKYKKQMDEEFEERRRNLTICHICDNKDIKIIDCKDGPIALCDFCHNSIQKSIERQRMAELGKKLKYIIGDVIPRKSRKRKKTYINHQNAVIECIENICKNLGINTRREYRTRTGRIDLILETAKGLCAIEVERQKCLTNDKFKINSIGKGAIVFDTYKDKIDEEFIKQLVSSDGGIKVFV